MLATAPTVSAFGVIYSPLTHADSDSEILVRFKLHWQGQSTVNLFVHSNTYAQPACEIFYFAGLTFDYITSRSLCFRPCFPKEEKTCRPQNILTYHLKSLLLAEDFYFFY